MNTDSQRSKQEACFARAIQVWLAVNHNIRVTSGYCPASNSDSDVMFVYKVIRDFKSIDHLCIYPIRRIGLKHK